MAYTELECEYHFGVEFEGGETFVAEKGKVSDYEELLKVAKDKGYVLLLKSRGENYLREHINDKFVLEDA